MKALLLLLTLLLAALTTGCNRSNTAEGPNEPEFKDEPMHKVGRGIYLPEKTKQAIGLQVTEVVEERIAPAFTAQVQVIRGASDGIIQASNDPAQSTAAGWLSAEQAAVLKPGQSVKLQSVTQPGPAMEGSIARVDKSANPVLGDMEVTVHIAELVERGTLFEATFRADAGEAVAAVPRSALLEAAEGTFVFVLNGGSFLKTPVKVGTSNEQFVEITDGVLPGDQVASAAVRQLWLTELMFTKGGHSCCEVK